MIKTMHIKMAGNKSTRHKNGDHYRKKYSFFHLCLSVYKNQQNCSANSKIKENLNKRPKQMHAVSSTCRTPQGFSAYVASAIRTDPYHRFRHKEFFPAILTLVSLTNRIILDVIFFFTM